MAIATNPKIAFKEIDFKNVWLFICNISNTKALIDSQKIDIVARMFKKITYIIYM